MDSIRMFPARVGLGRLIMSADMLPTQQPVVLGVPVLLPVTCWTRVGVAAFDINGGEMIKRIDSTPKNNCFIFLPHLTNTSHLNLTSLMFIRQGGYRPSDTWLI
jgi:hypothetical protein